MPCAAGEPEPGCNGTRGRRAIYTTSQSAAKDDAGSSSAISLPSRPCTPETIPATKHGARRTAHGAQNTHLSDTDVLGEFRHLSEEGSLIEVERIVGVLGPEETKQEKMERDGAGEGSKREGEEESGLETRARETERKERRGVGK